MWSLLSRANLLLLSRALEHSEILFPTLSFIFHASPLCVSNLPRELTVAALFSIHLSLYSTRSRPLHGGAEIHLYRLQPRAHVVSAEVAPFQCSISFCKKIQHCKHFSISQSRSFVASVCFLLWLAKRPFWKSLICEIGIQKVPNPILFFPFFQIQPFFIRRGKVQQRWIFQKHRGTPC